MSGDDCPDARASQLFEQLAACRDEDRRREIRDVLVTMHLPVARHVAERFAGRGEPVDDLAQVAALGLIKAVERFDPSRGAAFLAFAVPTMMGEVRRHFRDTTWSVRLPRRLSELHLSLGRATQELSQRLGRAPTPSQLAAHLNIPVAEVLEGLEAGQAYHAAPLDRPDEDGGGLSERLGAEDPELGNVEMRATLRPALAKIPERERRILVMRFFGHMTQTQIASRVGMSQMQVSRLLARTLSTLRELLSRPSDGEDRSGTAGLACDSARRCGSSRDVPPERSSHEHRC